MTIVLADTSVWRRHLAGGKGVAALSTLLEEGDLLVHPWVVAELLLGGLSASTEALLRKLPAANVVPDGEVLSFVRARRLQQRGVGWVDVHLLASTLVHGARLWTFDKALATAAEACDVAYRATVT